MNQELLELAKKYLAMVDEEDGHSSTDERNKERTAVHNELIEKMVSNGMCHAYASRATVRWLARYLVKEYEPKEKEVVKVMFLRKSSRMGELLSCPPFDEWEETKALDLYEPVIVTFKSWNKDGNNGLPRLSD